MGKRGPQPLPEHLRRNYRIGVCFTEDELLELESMLDQPGFADLVMTGGKDVRKGMKSASEFMRARALGQRVPRLVPKINQLAFAELGRIGSDVNQIAAGILIGLLNPSDSLVLSSIMAELTALREKLLGIAVQVADSGDTELLD
jgi:hypothetical protein